MKKQRLARRVQTSPAMAVGRTTTPVQDRSLKPLAGWLVAGFLCLGAFLRIYNFLLPELWIDEYGTWWDVSGGDWGDMVGRVISVGSTSPFYYFIVRLFTDFFGTSRFSLRLPSILFGIGLLGLVYPLGIRIFRDRHAALLCVAAFALNDTMIWYSQDARPYALALFCVVLSFLFYLLLLEKEKLSYRIGYATATAAAFYAQFLFGFIVVIQIFHLFVTRRWSWVYEKVWQYTFVGLLLLCLPGAFQFVSLFMRREAMNWLPPPAWDDWVRVAVKFLDPYILFGTSLGVVFTYFTGGERNKPQTQTEKKLLFLWLLLPVLVFSVILYLFGLNLIYYRYVLFAAPAALFIFAWLMASGIKAGWRKWLPLGAFLTLAFLLNLIPSLKAYGTFVGRPDHGWSKAADYLKIYGQDGDLVLLRTGFIEGDSLAKPNLSPLLVSFISWPLVAHLASGHRFHVINLPYLLNDQTRPYVASVYMEAAKRPRVWIIGASGLTSAFAYNLVAVSSFHPLLVKSFGVVQLFLLVKEAR